jgi:DNA (cytosine-5)-methyltransferase 1
MTRKADAAAQKAYDLARTGCFWLRHGALIGDDFLAELAMLGFSVRRYGDQAALDDDHGQGRVLEIALIYRFADEQAQYQRGSRHLKGAGQVSRADRPRRRNTMTFSFHEYFAGGGMVGEGLGDEWECKFANDVDPAKGRSYRANFPDNMLKICDVTKLTVNDLPSQPVDLAAMTPPCVGHSEAGDRRGFDDAESGAFWPAMRLIEALVAAQKAPRMVLFENVPAITSENLAAVQGAFVRAGYRCATRIVDAQHFVPQSRERRFVTGAHESLGVDPEPLFERAMRALPKRSIELVDIVDFNATPDRWEFPPSEVKRHLAMMSASQRAQFDQACATGRPVAIPFSRRMRGPKGNRIQRVEARFDGIASALRVPAAR